MILWFDGIDSAAARVLVATYKRIAAHTTDGMTLLTVYAVVST